MTSYDIQRYLRKSTGYNSVYVSEFTWGDMRIDGILIDIKDRWIRGYEIKVSIQDFSNDKKWVEYSEFCSSLVIVCPEGMIEPNEVSKPFGLLWVKEEKESERKHREHSLIWKKKAINFQKRNSLAWYWTYTKVLETEFKRLDNEIRQLIIVRNQELNTGT